MTGGIDKIQHVVFAVFGTIDALHRLVLDCNAPFLFQVHGVQDLFFHFPFGQGTGHLNEPVGQRGFAMIDMGND